MAAVDIVVEGATAGVVLFSADVALVTSAGSDVKVDDVEGVQQDR